MSLPPKNTSKRHWESWQGLLAHTPSKNPRKSRVLHMIPWMWTHEFFNRFKFSLCQRLVCADVLSVLVWSTGPRSARAPKSWSAALPFGRVACEDAQASHRRDSLEDNANFLLNNFCFFYCFQFFAELCSQILRQTLVILIHHAMARSADLVHSHVVEGVHDLCPLWSLDQARLGALRACQRWVHSCIFGSWFAMDCSSGVQRCRSHLQPLHHCDTGMEQWQQQVWPVRSRPCCMSSQRPPTQQKHHVNRKQTRGTSQIWARSLAMTTIVQRACLGAIYVGPLLLQRWHCGKQWAKANANKKISFKLAMITGSLSLFLLYQHLLGTLWRSEHVDERFPIT